MKKTLLTGIFVLALLTAFAQPTFTHVECGTEFTLALRSDGTLWACGNNSLGEIAQDSTIAYSDSLMQVLPSKRFIYAATGAFHALAIATDSTLWGWGLNAYGEVGTGTIDTLDPLRPMQISATEHWRYVSAGEVHTAALKGDGTLWTTGDNSYGELGIGTSDTLFHPAFTQIGTDTWKNISAGGVFTLAIKQDGTLWGFGYNGDGELGIGTTNNIVGSPIQVGTDNDWSMVSGGYEFSLALKSDGTIWSTGFNGNGQLGRTITGHEDSVFSQIGTESDWKFITAGPDYGLAIKQNGTLWGWGFNLYGQLGFTSTASSVVALTQVGTDTTWQYVSAADGALSGSSLYGLHSAGLKTNATGFCTTGADYIGQLGNGITINTPGAQFSFGCSIGESVVPEIVSNVVNNSKIPSVYPNPVTDILHIYDIEKSGNYQVLNMVGSVVQKGNLQEGENSLSMETLASGVYMLIINTEASSRYNIRIVKN